MNPTHTLRGAAGRILTALVSIPSPAGPGTWAGESTGARTRLTAGSVSFGRIVAVPFATWVAALERWQLTGHDGQLRLGQSLLRGSAEHDRHFRTCYIEARLARGPLRPPVRMRLGIDQWSATSTALELIPCRNIRPSPAYLRAGRALLDCLTHALPAQVPVDVAGGRVGADQAWAPAGLMWPPA